MDEEKHLHSILSKIGVDYKPWYTMRETCRILGISRTTVKALIKDGDIICYRPGKSKLYVMCDSLSGYLNLRIDKPHEKAVES